MKRRIAKMAVSLLCLFLCFGFREPHTTVDSVPLTHEIAKIKPHTKPIPQVMQHKSVHKSVSKPKKKTIRPQVIYETYEVTAYTSGPESTDKHIGEIDYGICADGKPAIDGITVAAPRSIPFGTKIYIPKLHHTYTVMDRGGAITSNHLDVYMSSLNDALDFGRQKLLIEIVH